MLRSPDAKYRTKLPQLAAKLFLTDGGLETSLIYHDGFELPSFASFVLLDSQQGIAAIRRYYEQYIATALAAGAGFVLETPTWRANPDWGAKIGYDRAELKSINRRSVALMTELRSANELPGSPMVVGGVIGPRGDGYVADSEMSAAEAEDYHGWQVRIFADTQADLVTAMTMTNIGEAAGVARAAEAAAMPCVISFTVETDGHLPSGATLRDAIEAVDAATRIKPAYYMINCAHPTHFDHVLEPGSDWVRRIKGLRANSSKCSHAELDAATELDIGNPVELGEEYAAILRRFPHINVLGGCCGTDHRHIACISSACGHRIAA